MGWIGNLAFQDCHSALWHCPLSSEWGCLSNNQISQHASHGLGAVVWKHSQTFMPENWWNWHKMDASHINKKFFSTSESRGFHNCKYFYGISAQNPDWLQECWIRSIQVVLKINWVKNLTAVTQLSNLSLKAFSRQLSMAWLSMKLESCFWAKILYGHSVVSFQCDFSNWGHGFFLIARLLVTWLNQVHCYRPRIFKIALPTAKSLQLMVPVDFTHALRPIFK